MWWILTALKSIPDNVGRLIIVILWMLRSFKERIQETEEAHGLLNNHLQTNVQVKNDSEGYVLGKLLPLYFCIYQLLCSGNIRFGRAYCHPEVRSCWATTFDHMTLCRRALEDKKPPLKVAETRLANRSHRPNIEVSRLLDSSWLDTFNSFLTFYHLLWCWEKSMAMKIYGHEYALIQL